MAALLLLARAAVLLAALAGILVGIVIGVVAPLADVTFAPVLSPSMRPALREGDLLVVRRVPTSTLELGAIVLLERDETTPSAHRVVALTRGSEGVRVRTRGDANPADDPGTVLLEGRTVPVVAGRLPSLGRPALALDAPPMRAVLGGVVLVSLVLALRRLVDERRTTGP